MRRNIQIMLIIALGEPAEQVRIESTVDTSGNIRYWRDDRRPPCAQTALNEVILDSFPK
ncbi:MAG: hypothetical protein R2874_15765 [Desulfobacterales bacterium]